MTYISINQPVAPSTHRPRPAARPVAGKWSPRRTLAFVVASSLALWMLILSPFLFF